MQYPQMIRILSLLILVRGNVSLIDTLNQTSRLYNSGDFKDVEAIFKTSEKLYYDNEKFQEEWLRFLIKTGKYAQVIEMQGVRPTNQHFVESAKKYLDILNSKDLKSIFPLMEISPNCFEVVVAAAKHSLMLGNYGNFNKFIGKADQLGSDPQLVKELKAQFHFITFDIERGLQIIKELGMDALYQEMSGLYNNYKSIPSNSQNGMHKYIQYKELVSILFKKTLMDSYSPSIYKTFYNKVLESAVIAGCEANVKEVSSFAKRLILVEESENNIFLLIKAYLIDGKIEEAKQSFNKNSKKLNEVRKKMLTSLISLNEKRAFDEQQKRQEQERRNEQQRRQTQNSGSQAGEDFLGYYKVLGVTRSASQKELKKAHKKKAREASKMTPTCKSEDPLKKVNKAFQILSDVEKKRMYDQGINPESPQMHQQQQRSGNSFMQEDDIGELFKAMFGHKQNRNRRGNYEQFSFSFR